MKKLILAAAYLSFLVSNAVSAQPVDANLPDSDLNEVTCYEEHPNGGERLKILEIVDGKITFLKFFNGSVRIDKSTVTDKCGGASFCGFAKWENIPSGHFAFFDETKELFVTKGNARNGGPSTRYAPVNCEF